MLITVQILFYIFLFPFFLSFLSFFFFVFVLYEAIVCMYITMQYDYVYMYMSGNKILFFCVIYVFYLCEDELVVVKSKQCFCSVYNICIWLLFHSILDKKVLFQVFDKMRIHLFQVVVFDKMRIHLFQVVVFDKMHIPVHVFQDRSLLNSDFIILIKRRLVANCFT